MVRACRAFEVGRDKGPVMTIGRNRRGKTRARLHALPTFMPAHGALLTTNKSTARSNLSQRSVGRRSGVCRERGRKGKEKKVEMKERGVERKSEKWQGKRLTHMAAVATLLPVATGSSSIKWQDIFQCSIISTEVTTLPQSREDQQGHCTHDWICLNWQKTFNCTLVL